MGKIFTDQSTQTAEDSHCSPFRLSQARFSQGQERRADEFGLALLYQTYGHVAGATDFFTRLGEQYCSVKPITR